MLILLIQFLHYDRNWKLRLLAIVIKKNILNFPGHERVRISAEERSEFYQKSDFLL